MVIFAFLGSLVMKSGDEDLVVAKPTLLFGTLSGSIGVVATLEKKVYKLLDQLQKEMYKLDSAGSLDPIT